MCVCVSSHSNWGTENDPDFEYHNGNKEPKGFGNVIMMANEGLLIVFCSISYIQVTLELLYQTCTRLVRGLKHWE